MKHGCRHAQTHGVNDISTPARTLQDLERSNDAQSIDLTSRDNWEPKTDSHDSPSVEF